MTRPQRTVILQVKRTPPAPVAAPEPDAELYRPMTQTEAAAWLGIDPATLSQWTTAGDVPCLRVGTKPRYLKADLIAHFRERAAA